MLHDLDMEMSEEEQQRDQRERSDQKGAAKQHPEKPVIVFEVHVEHHDDQEFQRGEAQQRGNECA